MLSSATIEQSEVDTGERVTVPDGWTGKERDRKKEGAKVERPSHLEVFDSKLIIGGSSVWFPGHLT